jgi:anti-sigma factor RsiW
MSDLDDARLRTAMRAYLDACDALDQASAASDADRELLDRADTKTLTEMVLRQQLQRVGWTAPREVQPADSGND